MHGQLRVFVIVQACASQAGVVELESQGADQVQRGASIGAQPDYIASVGRYFWPEEDDMQHPPIIGSSHQPAKR
jgi:hypothetical protein